MTVCTCCGHGTPVAGLRHCGQPDGGTNGTFALLCEDCCGWLTSLLQAILRGGESPAPLLGLPTAGERAMLFADQCQLCRALPGEGPSQVECRPLSTATSGWRAISLCPACDAWLVNIARDGRSARGRAARLIDGPYGEWPHPNLRFLHVAIDQADEAVEQAIRRACAEMEIDVCSPSEITPGAILFFQVGAGRRTAPPGGPLGGMIAVASLGARAELLEALAAGASDWLTAPLTPQQVTSALIRVPARWKSPVAYDPFTALPVVDIVPVDRPVVEVQPLRGTGLFELVWLLRRHTRGYDDLFSLPTGDIIFSPRARPQDVQPLLTRLEELLDGRCRFIERPGTGTHRLDAVG